MNKALIGNILVLLLLTCMVMVALTIFAGDATTTYSANSTELENATYLQTAQEVTEMSTSMKTNIENAKITNIDIVDAPLMVLAGGIEAIKILFSTMDITVNLITDLAATTGIIPDWAVNFVLAIAIITISLALLGSMIKFELVRL